MKRRQEIEVSNKLIKSLIERGFLVHQYYARTTKSVYLKLDYGACCGIRISDHRGKKKYKYKFNLIKQYEGSKTVLPVQSAQHSGHMMRSILYFQNNLPGSARGSSLRPRGRRF